MKKKLCFILLAMCILLTACTSVKKVESYKIGTGAHQCYAVIGDSLMTASDTAERIFGVNGEDKSGKSLDMKYPAISETADNAVVFDIGGTSLSFFDGSSLESKNVIINAALSESGYLAVCTEEAGYKGSVTVYSADKTEAYKWYSADNWILKAEVSPDGKTLAVLCSGEDGGSVHIFALSGTEETGSFTADGAVFNDMHWLDDTICCIADDMLYFCNAEGKSVDEYSFGGKNLGSYASCDDEIVVELRTHSFGGAGTLIAVSADAKECGRANPGAEVEGFDWSDGKLLTMCQGKLLCYDGNLKLLGTCEVSGCEGAYLRTDDILVVSAGEAKITQLNK